MHSTTSFDQDESRSPGNGLNDQNSRIEVICFINRCLKSLHQACIFIPHCQFIDCLKHQLIRLVKHISAAIIAYQGSISRPFVTSPVELRAPDPVRSRSQGQPNLESNGGRTKDGSLPSCIVSVLSVICVSVTHKRV